MRIYTLDGKCNLSGARVKEARLRLGLQIGQMAVSRTETGKRLAPDFELPINSGRGPVRNYRLAAGQRIIPQRYVGGFRLFCTQYLPD